MEPEVYFFSPDIRVNPDVCKSTISIFLYIIYHAYFQGYTGSLVVTPIHSCHSGTIATLNVDSLVFNEENTDPYTEFDTHECQFYKVQ